MRLQPTPPADRRRPIRALAGAVAAVAVSLALPATAARADESPVQTVVGQVVQVYPEAGPDGDHDADGAPLTLVETATGEVRIPTEAAGDLPVGATVEVTVGGKLPDAAAEAGLEPALDLLDAQLLRPAEAADDGGAAPLTNEVTVVRVLPPGGSDDGTSLEQLVTAVDGPVAGFWAGESDGAIRVGVTTAVPGWVPATVDCAEPTVLWNQVAAAVGFQEGPGRHLLLYVAGAPGDGSGCAYAMGEVGSGPGAGGRLYIRDVLPSVISHELGHNFGLGHSSGHQCDGVVEGGTCRTAAYRDYYDVMGASWSQAGALNAPQAAALGVLPAAAQATLPADGATTTLTLAPLSGRTGTRAVRLAGADGGTYWLEYRAAALRDAWLGTAENRFRLQTGVLLHRAGSMPDTSLLLDGTPTPAGSWNRDLQAALPVGTPVSAPGGGLTVTVTDVTAAGATVTVATTAAVTPVAPATPAGGPAVLAGAPAPAPRGPVSTAPAVPAPQATPAPQAAPTPQAAELPEPTPTPAQAEEAPTELRTQAQETVDPAATGTSRLPLLAVAVGAVALFLAGAWAGRRLGARP